ncbi:MAG: 4a-hydroxytetrahydrobiopterin dehydratase [Clostridia bacterium]
MRRLAADELASALATLREWRGSSDGIERWFEWESFQDAVAFVDEVAAIAEAASHHPDLDIRFNRVRVFLVTHDAGGVTDRDVAVARAVDHLVGP